MEYAVYVLDVQHIVLDNLQFMMGTGAAGRASYDKYEMQERALEAFRRFATDKNVHVTVVIHPRKEPDGIALSLSSVFGSAKATQEADTVIALQILHKNQKRLDVLKNRYDGTLDTMMLHYDPRSQSYTAEPSGDGEGGTAGGGGVVQSGQEIYQGWADGFRRDGGVPPLQQDHQQDHQQSPSRPQYQERIVEPRRSYDPSTSPPSSPNSMQGKPRGGGPDHDERDWTAQPGRQHQQARTKSTSARSLRELPEDAYDHVDW